MRCACPRTSPRAHAALSTGCWRLADQLGLIEVRRALAEDRADEDVTTRLLGAAATQSAEARFVAEGSLLVAGVPLLATVFHELDPAAVVTQAQITHTRKTTPGLRNLELYAVLIAGGVENRASLADAILWKDNHWALLNGNGRSLHDALRNAPVDLPVIVEVESDEQVEAALAAGVTHLLVDNQPPDQLAAWARRAGSGVTIQASGGITGETARAYAEAGASLIAIGALTHSALAAPIRCDILAGSSQDRGHPQ